MLPIGTMCISEAGSIGATVNDGAPDRSEGAVGEAGDNLLHPHTREFTQRPAQSRRSTGRLFRSQSSKERGAAVRDGWRYHPQRSVRVELGLATPEFDEFVLRVDVELSEDRLQVIPDRVRTQSQLPRDA